MVLAMLFFVVCAVIWTFRVPVVNGVPISFNSDEPSHYVIVRYIATHWQLPPYTREFYESAHPPLSDFIEAAYVRLFPVDAWVYALRLFSTAVGLGTLFLIYKTSKLIVSEWTAAFVTAFVALLPMFILISSSVTNDAIAVFMSTATLYFIVKALKDGLSKKQLNILCLLVGLGGIAKYTFLGLLPVSIGAVIYDCRRSGKSWIVPVLSIVASFTLISGWWYLRNQMLFGDPLRARAEAQVGMFVGNAGPSQPSYWIEVFRTMTGSFLGLYPTFPEWPPSVYYLLTAMFGILVCCAIVIAIRRPWSPIKIALGIYALTVLAVVLEYQIDHKQPHGRLLSPAILVIALGIAGLRHAIPAEKRTFIAMVALFAMADIVVAVTAWPFAAT